MVPKQFKDTDLKVFIGVASKDGGIKYHETDLSYAYWRHRMNKACTSAGLDRITFSRFRNSLSLALIQTGVPTNAHQQMLGHSRHPYSDGRTHVVLTPRELLVRLCALIPYPRTHLLTYHGVLAPASTWRDEVVPSPTRGVRARSGSSAPLSQDRRLRWAGLMKRTFEVDVLRCECGGERRVIAFITEPGTARAILEHLGLGSEPVVSVPSRAPPLLDFG